MTREQSVALASGVELLERAVNYTLSSLHLVTVDALARPSPCVDWDLRSLLGHLDDSLSALCEAVEGGAIEVECPGGPPEPDPVPDPVATLRDRACRILGAWANTTDLDVVAIGEYRLTTGLVSTTGALEITVHGWDIAQTCGGLLPIPAGLARELLLVAPLIVTEDDRPVRFAAARGIPTGADASTRLLAFLGRPC